VRQRSSPPSVLSRTRELQPAGFCVTGHQKRLNTSGKYQWLRAVVPFGLVLVRARARALLTFVLLSTTVVTSSAQKANKLEIEHWREVLRTVERELKENYYDPTFNGIDIDARFKLADAKMKNAASMDELEGIVAQVLLDLNDPHTFFIPPDDDSRVEYGWRLRPVGPDSYVGAVRPGSDAWAKGLRPGDKVLSIDGRPSDRDQVWVSNYLYYALRREPTTTVVVQKPDQTQQQLVIKANVNKSIGGVIYASPWVADFKRPEEYRSSRHRFHELSKEVLIWQMPHFYLDEYDLREKFGKLKNRKVLILDLRGNSRGFLDTLPHLAGYFFNSNIKLADRRGRKDLQPIVAKSKKENSFKGRLIVLIDGESASSAEIFARSVQLQNRGVVIGDRSSGSVMESKLHPMHVGIMRAIPCVLSATNADVIMPDGARLEQVGVTPDKLLLPTPQDMSANHDPVLAYAASLAGIELDPKKAGELFPSRWRARR
jgi:carboxyl-terminal processing protease